MLAGRRPFSGEDVAETLAAVLRADPDWSALPDATPLYLRRLVAGCLKKDRQSRIADIGTINSRPLSLPRASGM
jgi:serine/threonine-protein kinase